MEDSRAAGLECLEEEAGPAVRFVIRWQFPVLVVPVHRTLRSFIDLPLNIRSHCVRVIWDPADTQVNKSCRRASQTEEMVKVDNPDT